MLKRVTSLQALYDSIGEYLRKYGDASVASIATHNTNSANVKYTLELESKHEFSCRTIGTIDVKYYDISSDTTVKLKVGRAEYNIYSALYVLQQGESTYLVIDPEVPVNQRTLVPMSKTLFLKLMKQGCLYADAPLKQQVSREYPHTNARYYKFEMHKLQQFKQ